MSYDVALMLFFWLSMAFCRLRCKCCFLLVLINSHFWFSKFLSFFCYKFSLFTLFRVDRQGSKIMKRNHCDGGTFVYSGFKTLSKYLLYSYFSLLCQTLPDVPALTHSGKLPIRYHYRADRVWNNEEKSFSDLEAMFK